MVLGERGREEFCFVFEYKLQYTTELKWLEGTDHKNISGLKDLSKEIRPSLEHKKKKELEKIYQFIFCRD